MYNVFIVETEYTYLQRIKNNSRNEKFLRVIDKWHMCKSLNGSQDNEIS